jgi:hypothetical protein
MIADACRPHGHSFVGADVARELVKIKGGRFAELPRRSSGDREMS